MGGNRQIHEAPTEAREQNRGQDQEILRRVRLRQSRRLPLRTQGDDEPGPEVRPRRGEGEAGFRRRLSARRRAKARPPSPPPRPPSRPPPKNRFRTLPLLLPKKKERKKKKKGKKKTRRDDVFHTHVRMSYCYFYSFNPFAFAHARAVNT